MLTPYFLVGLLPLSFQQKPSLTTKEFLQKAQECLSETVVDDLAEIERMALLDRTIREALHAQALGRAFSWPSTEILQILQDYHDQAYFVPLVSEEPQVLRRLLWEMMAKNSKSEFVKKFATESVNFYEVLAAVLAKKNHVSKNLYERELLGCFDSTAKMIDFHFNDKDFLLSSRHGFMAKIDQALQHDDPLELEYCVAEQLFLLADDCADPDEFHADKILAYFIKLMICERFASFDEDNGQVILQELMKSVRRGGFYE